MKSSIIYIFILATSLLKGQNTNDIFFDVNPRYWEDPSGNITGSADIDFLDQLGTWTFFEKNKLNERIDLFERDITCKCDIIHQKCYPKIYKIATCDLTYEIDNPSCSIEPYWVDPLGNIHNQQTIDNNTMEGWWYLHLDTECETLVDSIWLEDCFAVLCDNINDSALAATEPPWNETFTSHNSGTVSIEFGTEIDPDKLIILLNGVEVVNSGDYSSTLCNTVDYVHCQGTVVSGCDNNFMVDIEVEIGDVLEFTIYGNSCYNEAGTFWSLTATCTNVNTRSSKSTSKTVDDLEYYPNPASTLLNIEVRGEVLPSSISLTNSKGVEVLRLANVGRNNVLDISKLPSGLYLSVATYKDHVRSQKIIISR